MLWRAGYQTSILHEVPLEPITMIGLDGALKSLPEGILLGGFGVGSLTELGIWRKLCRADLQLEPPAAIFVAGDKERQSVSNSIAKSQFAITATVLEEPWPIRLVRGQSFGMVIRNQRAKLLMLGLPTEDAWDLFKLTFQEPAPPTLQPRTVLSGKG